MILALWIPMHASGPQLDGLRPRPVYVATSLITPTIGVAATAVKATAHTGRAEQGKVVPVSVAPVFGPLDLRIPTVGSIVPLSQLPAVSTGGSSPIAIAKPVKPPIDNTLCDVVCSSADLTTVLSMLSTTTKANLIAIDASTNKLTLSLRRVKLSEALDLISTSVGMTYLKVGSAFILGTKEKLSDSYPKEWEKAHPTPPKVDPPVAEPPPVEPTRTVTYPLSHAAPDQMVATLKMLFESKGLVAVVGPSTNSPTLSDRDSASGTGISSGVIQGDAKPNGKLLILRGPASVVEAAQQAIHDLDQPRPQVSIEVSIFDVTDSALNELGISWNIGGTSFQESDPKGVNFGSFTRTPFNFGATIKALETADKAKILASPNVSVLDEERAFVLIGNKITLPKFDGYDANKIPIYSTAEYRVGIYLQVAPSVAADGTITMAIYPQVSTVVKTTEINGASYPDIATREAQTTLRVKSGESIILGGLLKNEELEQLEQVPILSKIPVFGELFKRRKKTKASSQVIISLTPTLIRTNTQ